MKGNVKESFESLLNKALENAKEDRKLALDAYDNVKEIFNIKADEPETMQAVLLIGQSAVKLIEQSSRSNEQIIRLAQLKEKEERALQKSEEEDEGPQITMEDLRKAQNGS